MTPGEDDYDPYAPVDSCLDQDLSPPRLRVFEESECSPPDVRESLSTHIVETVPKIETMPVAVDRPVDVDGGSHSLAADKERDMTSSVGATDDYLQATGPSFAPVREDLSRETSAAQEGASCEDSFLHRLAGGSGGGSNSSVVRGTRGNQSDLRTDAMSPHFHYGLPLQFDTRPSPVQPSSTLPTCGSHEVGENFMAGPTDSVELCLTGSTAGLEFRDFGREI